MEYREIFLTLLRKYDETRQPHSYLKDLVESTHLFLRMLERFCSGRKNLMVQVSSCPKFVVCGNSCHQCPTYNINISLCELGRRRKWSGKDLDMIKSPRLQKQVQRPWQRHGRSWRKSWRVQGFRLVWESTSRGSREHLFTDKYCWRQFSFKECFAL